MLARLYATNYRCLVNFEFHPTSKQLIIGRNGAGKTTVLDVLAMLRNQPLNSKPRTLRSVVKMIESPC
jgi:predicted ATPase